MAVPTWRPEDQPSGPAVKICGLTRLEDVLHAWDLGVWATGFVFAPSPRRLTPAAAYGLIREAARRRPDSVRELKSPGVRLTLTIGVFGDVSAEEIATVVEDVDLDGVQLHGLGSPGGDTVRSALAERGRVLTGRGRPLLVIQAVPVDPEIASADSLAQMVTAARTQADVVLLDTKAGGRFGGSGTAFPWRLAREAAADGPLLVAGGIGPENARAALDESGAWGVDVSSGVELSPGIKDPALMKDLIARAGAGRSQEG
ncbi:MAG: phosphoribosylanthranilate isomerase [Thermoleophilia bacterium]|nr:phosphoribosylanthranilate isomerase [Thermoleophilia bacterium]